jgi:hypothetical protein
MDYPVIWISREDDAVGVFKSNEDLRSIPIGSSKYYLTLDLYSIDQNCYKILGVEKKRSRLFKKMTSLLQFRVRVEMDLAIKETNFASGTIKERLREIMLDNQEYWDADGMLQDRLLKLSSATTAAEIINVFL